MAVIEQNIVDSIKLVGSLKGMGENQSAALLGQKIIASFPNSKDGMLFNIAYDPQKIDSDDVKSLLDAAFLASCLEEVYRTFKTVTAGSKAEYWFKNGKNDADLHRFFLFLARVNRTINVDSDVPIFKGAIKALKNNPTYTIPSGMMSFTLERFLRGIATGEVKVDAGGIR